MLMTFYAIKLLANGLVVGEGWIGVGVVVQPVTWA
jgi:hypothetical protein